MLHRAIDQLRVHRLRPAEPECVPPITAHFLAADALGVPRERAMEIMREELWIRDRPIADRVRAATERLRGEQP
jgi:hypothetical protein